MLCAVIMAGGKGTRFWPLSTEEKPKQFLNLLGDDTMLQMTVNRLLPLIPIERIFIVTGEQYAGLVKEQLPTLNEKNIIVEPIGRNTAPCIALAAFYIKKFYEDATMVVLPSDHLIKDEAKLLNIIESAGDFVNNKKESIVTIGMTPDRPETGYGYINFNNDSHIVNGNEVKGVVKFVEKPNLEKALEYIRSGKYLWNGGMFVWKVNNILNLTYQYLENTYNVLSEIAATEEASYKSVLQEKYKEVDNISVDFGIMEKTNNIFVIPGDFGWDDVGSWFALERYREKDEDSNVLIGDVIKLEGKRNIIVGNKKPIVISGIEDMLIVESDELIFIGKKEEINKISEIRQNFHS